MYNYLDAIMQDVRTYIDENIDLEEMREEYTEDELVEVLREHLHDECFFEDSVTGNTSGSYFCNAYDAEEALCGNWSLAAEAWAEFGPVGRNPFAMGAEFVDVTIRCYLLGAAIDEVLEEDFGNE